MTWTMPLHAHVGAAVLPRGVRVQFGDLGLIALIPGRPMGSIVTVFGGTGFLGRRVVQHLRERQYSVRNASRHPDRGRIQFGIEDPQLQTIEADIHDERSVTDTRLLALTVW